MNHIIVQRKTILNLLTGAMMLAAITGHWAHANESQPYAHAATKPPELFAARITGGYLGAYIDRARDLSLVDLYAKMDQRGSLKNFRIVAERLAEKHAGGPNEDEWVHKMVEAAGYFAPRSKAVSDTFQPLLRDMLAAQAQNGYLNTFYQNPLVIKKEGPNPRFRPKNRFEFYDFGHMAQAGIAWKLATGDDRLFKAAIRFADLLCERFGSQPLPYNYESKLPSRKYEHPNHEMAMVELYRMTGERRYLDFAAHTLECYGFWSFPEVWGHCVQENLLLCGGADVYLETGKPEMLRHLEAMWTDITERKMYLTGGVGNGVDSENYGAACVLPNVQNYCETCAAISKVFFDWRMLLATNQAKYADDMERTLYNAVLSGISFSGTEYFYTNHMEEPGPAKSGMPNDPQLVGNDVRDSQRMPFCGCPCCPPNVLRLLGSLQQYTFTVNKDGVQAQLYANAEFKARLDSGETVHLRETTDYPRKGWVGFEMLAPGNFSFALRIPSWTESSGSRVTINGKPGPVAKPGEYVRINRAWKKGDRVDLEIVLTPRLIPGREQVAAEKSKLALMRGPLVYCLESPDNPAADIFKLQMRRDSVFKEKPADVLGGTIRLTGNMWETGRKTETRVTAIPYHLWANRGQSQMRIWIPMRQGD